MSINILIDLRQKKTSFDKIIFFSVRLRSAPEAESKAEPGRPLNAFTYDKNKTALNRTKVITEHKKKSFEF